MAKKKEETYMVDPLINFLIDNGDKIVFVEATVETDSGLRITFDYSALKEEV